MRRSLAIALSSTLIVQAAALRAAPAMAGVRAAGAQIPVATGVVNGTARSAAGQTLPNHTVQLRNLQTGRLAGTTTSNGAGAFSFAGLSPANYAVEIVNPAGAIVGSSAAIAVTTGATVSVGVLATAASTGAASGAFSSLVAITTIASAAGIAGVVAVAQREASTSR